EQIRFLTKEYELKVKSKKSTSTNILANLLRSLAQRFQTFNVRFQKPDNIGCTAEEPGVCQFALYDPDRQLSQIVEIPVRGGGGPAPAVSMVALPFDYDQSDFSIRASNGRLVGDASLISVRGTIESSYGGRTCTVTEVESITAWDFLVYAGIDFRRLTLQEAIKDGLVVATIYGNGLTQINLSIKPTFETNDENLEIEILPGTLFISGTEGVQNMVVRRREVVYLSSEPETEVSLELEVSCANMELKMPDFSDGFTVSMEPVNEDLVKLLSMEDFRFNDTILQQFAVWTITENPMFTWDYTGITQGSYTTTVTESDVEWLRGLFLQAGIDPDNYLIFGEY
ncbi:MAG: hypothetical protein AAGU05_03790, partial [Anaerolineaceae bacterium]